MRPGGGHSKGAAYERAIAQKLSLWITHGKIADGLWRTSMSGGRATIALRRGEKLQQVGDLAAIRLELHTFTSKHYIECKHVRSLDIESFILTGKGSLATFWRTALKESLAHDARFPVIVAKQNRTPDIVLTGYELFPRNPNVPKASKPREWDLWLLADLLEQPYT